MDHETRNNRKLFYKGRIFLCSSGLEVRISTELITRYQLEARNGFLIMDDVTRVSYICSTNTLNSRVYVI